jgi:hypothetical protein
MIMARKGKMSLYEELVELADKISLPSRPETYNKIIEGLNPADKQISKALACLTLHYAVLEEKDPLAYFVIREEQPLIIDLSKIPEGLLYLFYILAMSL